MLHARHSVLGLIFLVLAACAAQSSNLPAAATPATGDAKLAGVLAGSQRSAENKARDPYRHPAETLAFFGLKDNMTVVEVSPGGGWYTEILAPYLRDTGTFYAAAADPKSDVPYARKSAETFQAKLAAQPQVYDQVKLTVFAPPDNLDIAPAGSADLVLTFRNVHNWMKAGAAQAAFNSFAKALKPGGVLGVVEHRASPEAPLAVTAPSGYVHESQVIALAEAAGLTLVERSEINANARDTKDHPAGVWTLPPSLRLGDKDREKYVAIGESDRMTLKFRKP